MLEGMKVVEMASIAAGPSAGAMLAEWGADVIKIEPLSGDSGRHTLRGLGVTDLAYNPEFDLHNRGKRSIALDLSRPESYAIISALVAKADVFLTNMLSEKQAERKLDWAHLSAVNPRLVHASISGYGSSGPVSQNRAIDHSAFWSRSGLAHLLTPKGQEPVPVRMAMGDRIAGLALLSGLLAAYIEAQRTGRGKVVETSLLRAGIYTVGTDMGLQGARGRVGSSQPRHSIVNPYQTFFPTKDDRWIAVNLGGGQELPAVLDHPELADDPRLVDAPTRRKHAAEIIDLFDSIFRERTLAEWCERLESANFIWAPVQTAADVVADPQAEAAGAFVSIPLKGGGAYRGPAMPVGFLNGDGERDGLPSGQAPELGENTDEILTGLGYAPDKVAALRAEGVIG
jgi:crotonobetainyl-CoA:carnitine CoA-transferase CaiB-like acyl-CoA transferase